MFSSAYCIAILSILSTECPCKALHSLLPSDRMLNLQVILPLNTLHLQQHLPARQPPPPPLQEPHKESPEKVTSGDEDDGVHQSVDEGNHAGNHVQGEEHLVPTPLSVRHEEDVGKVNGVADEEGYCEQQDCYCYLTVDLVFLPEEFPSSQREDLY